METIRQFEPADRYVYDWGLCSSDKNFAQVDTSQDASYFGTWANPFKRIIVCYCEGDVTLQIAETDAEFVAELRNIQQWNIDNGHRFLGIDPGFNKALAAKFAELGLADLVH
ncbi:MAG TPA: hypothetical protein VLA24_10705 [Pseudomonadales bacterium]|nr:hypothetical protein [Pseudomonadales bacterium]